MIMGPYNTPLKNIGI